MKFTALLLLTASMIAVQSARAITFIEWPVADGGNGHLYGITDSASDWITAEATAAALGGTLATSTSQEEQDFINATFFIDTFEHMPLWFGLTDEAVDDKFVWVTGEPLIFTYWKAGEPNNNGGNEMFVAANWDYSKPAGFKGSWNDTPLDGTRGFGGNTDGPYFGLVEIDPTNLALLSAASRVKHSSAGAFDIDMPLTGDSGVEDRCAGAYTAVFTFNNPVSSGEVALVSGTATIMSATANGNELSATLRNVADVQIVTLRVSNINGDSRQYGDIPFGFLRGDVDANRVVDLLDLQQVDVDKHQTVNASNFRDDIDLSGVVDIRDRRGVTTHLGNILP